MSRGDLTTPDRVTTLSLGSLTLEIEGAYPRGASARGSAKGRSSPLLLSRPAIRPRRHTSDESPPADQGQPVANFCKKQEKSCTFKVGAWVLASQLA